MTKLSFASLAMTGVTVTAVALACCSSVPEANAFTASPPQHPLLVSVCNPLSQQRSRSIVVDTTTTTTTTTTSRLYAKKPAKKNKKKPSAAAAAAATTTASSGGGFGKARVESTTTKVRTVSGHAGSGEKPLRQAANNFDAIFKEHGKDAIHDVYCYSPLDVDDDDNNNNNADTFWFVGKIAIKPGVSPRDGVLSQKRLILEYSKRELRPQNLGGKYARALELWLAPGDSEMDAVQNKVDFAKVDGTTKDLPQDFSVRDVGYNPEIYVGDEVTKGGLRVKRDPSTGKPIKAVFEVNQSM